MIFSFTSYLYFALILWFLGKIAESRSISLDKNTKRSDFFCTWEVVLILIVFSAFSGLRWKVGVDYLSYLEGYNKVLNGFEYLHPSGRSWEIGFLYLTNLFGALDAHFAFYFGFLAFLQVFFFYFALRREKYLYPFLGVLIIWGPHYLIWMNGIRQMIAACIFVFAVQFIRERNFKIYLIVIFVATLFHNTAILLIIFYFVPFKRLFINRKINLSLFAITFFLGLNPDWLIASDLVRQVLSIIGFDKYSQNLELVVSMRESMNFGPRRISILALILLSIWYAPKIQNYFPHSNYEIYFKFMLIGGLLFNLFGNTNHIFLRPVTYFSIFSVITTAYLLVYLKLSSPKPYNFKFIVVFFISIIYLLTAIYADSKNGQLDFTNYKFFFYTSDKF